MVNRSPGLNRNNIPCILGLLILLVLVVILTLYSLYFPKNDPLTSPDLAWQTYTNPFFGITLEYPYHWQHVDGDAQYGQRFAGGDGFFTVTAMGNAGTTLDQTVLNEVQHKLQPYGPDPRVENLWVDGQEARLISPSETQTDNLRWQAAVLVRYPQLISLTIGDTEHYYPIFALYADPAHIRAIADSIKFDIDPLKESEGIDLSEGNLTCLSFSEIKAELCWPPSYSIIQITEGNRRGSFAAYGFHVNGGSQTPYLSEIQFFSEESIASFTSNCGDDVPCFFGDFPDIKRYAGLKEAFMVPASYQDYSLKKFGDRDFFAKNVSCYGDDCVIREYTTFFGDVMVAVWVVMGDDSQIDLSDQLFNQLIFIQN